MWSDPDDIDKWATSPRGAGWLFGSKVTEEFMEKNQLELICRAHQLVNEGIKIDYIFKVLLNKSLRNCTFIKILFCIF